MKKSLYFANFKDIEPGFQIEEKKNKRGQLQVSCQRRISTCITDRIQLKLNEHHGLYVSRGTIYNLKPFFYKEPHTEGNRFVPP